jgi:hypothetical protein
MTRMTIREAAAVLALLLAAGCGGGGGVLSPLAPGVSGGAAPAAAVVTLAVMPATNIMPNVGSTAQVVASISSGAAGVPVSYVGGCEHVATITPATQNTISGGSTPVYTMTATINNAKCVARFTAGTASATTTAAVGSPTPMPSPAPSVAPSTSPTTGATAKPTSAPTSSPTSAPTAAPTAPPTVTPTAAPTAPPPPPGPMTVTPPMVYVGTDSTGTTSVPSATFVANDPNDSGAFLLSGTCTGIVTITPSGGVGPSITYTVIPETAGICTATVAGSGGSASTTITSTTFGLSINSKGRHQ